MHTAPHTDFSHLQKNAGQRELEHQRLQPKNRVTENWSPGRRKKQQAKTGYSTSQGREDLLLEQKSGCEADACDKSRSYRVGPVDTKDFCQTNEQHGSWNSQKSSSLLKSNHINMNTPLLEDNVWLSKQARCIPLQPLDANPCTFVYSGSSNSHGLRTVRVLSSSSA